MKNRRGFTLVEVMVASAIAGGFILLTMTYSKIMQTNTGVTRAISTRDRILAGVRSLAGMPASLRNSMRASDGAGTVVNPRLLACAGGNPANGCQSGISYAFTLYSPLVALDAAGNPVGIQPIASPMGSAVPMRFDNFGLPCTTAGPNCALLVQTAFKAQCGPPPLPFPRPAVITPEMLIPAVVCTIADLIDVTYQVQLDPNVVEANDVFTPFATPVRGTVATPVRLISGNQPQ
ncbi:MAG: type II secretion system protein [Bdellovibrionales bacterium]